MGLEINSIQDLKNILDSLKDYNCVSLEIPNVISISIDNRNKKPVLTEKQEKDIKTQNEKTTLKPEDVIKAFAGTTEEFNL